MIRRRIDRRAAGRQVMLAALLPCLALASPLGATVRTAIAAAPRGRFVLTRRLTRQLMDGEAIVVTRRWDIGFAARATGLVVSGRQISAEVSAPPVLSALARIEQDRVADAIFPIQMGKTGQIEATGVQSSEALFDAIETARVIFARTLAKERPPGDIARTLSSIGQTSAEAMSGLPRDLFFPQAGTQSSQQTVALAGGETGEITVVTLARTEAASGLLRESERKVITRFGGSERVTREEWTLTPAP